VVTGWSEDSGPRAAGEITRRDLAPQDSAYAHCLGCGKHVSGRDDAGFSAEGMAGRVEELARAHTAETGHPTRMYGLRPVAEFFLAA
jgi:hypothetical protein